MYVLDSNVFIQAHQKHYGLDFVPAFWDWVESANRSGAVISVDKVLEELTRQTDALATWAKQHKTLFAKIDSVTQLSLSTISAWVAQNYQPGAIQEFFGSADYVLVAFAEAHRCTVVTHEMPEDPKKTKKKVKIPDACRAFSVPYMDPFAMLRQEKARFVLPSP